MPSFIHVPEHLRVSNQSIMEHKENQIFTISISQKNVFPAITHVAAMVSLGGGAAEDNIASKKQF